tara:strand:+ start:79 stop:285 length:207 start_codon:yes stop_codon:yes gene_type:complete
MKLPITFDLTPEDKIVDRKHPGEKGYAENVQYTLQFNIQEDGVYISYYGEDDTYLDEDKMHELIEKTL